MSGSTAAGFVAPEFSGAEEILADGSLLTVTTHVPRSRRRIAILGTRGIPAAHGGFETFAERLAIYLAAQGWNVEVYCQDDSRERRAPTIYHGVVLVHLPVPVPGSVGSVLFDFASMRMASRDPERLLLVLGYNTALFGILARLRGRVQLINMDGIEWHRAKWSKLIKGWFWLNERLACWLGNHLIADNPHIADHLATRVRRDKITMIAYGADPVFAASGELLQARGLQPRKYVLIIARPEPENSTLEIVRAFSRRERQEELVVLGRFEQEKNGYHARVIAAAGPQVRFLGAIYDQQLVNTLRLHCRLYIHGHQVGGTNPSLVEALGAGCAILARWNPFNHWVAGSAARYFREEDECAAVLDELLAADEAQLDAMRANSRQRHAQAFLWPGVLAKYATMLEHWWDRTIAGRERRASTERGRNAA
jgi:glycosyltransferase involved in cell wall biosynthesis